MSGDTPVPFDVAISYPRATLSQAAHALRARLEAEGRRVFLDTTAIADGARFPEEITRAFLHSRVVVILADETYFRRWFCLRELRMALSPFEQVALRPASTPAQRAAALSHIVIGMGGPPAERRWMEQLPLDLRATQWPEAGDTEAIARLAGVRMARTIRESLAAQGIDPRQAETLGPDALLPPPRNLAGLRVVPRRFPASIGDRFAGRADDLWRMDFLLRTAPMAQPDGAPPVVSLEGGGGFGKTTLAREYVHRFGPGAFPGGIFWIDTAGGEAQLDPQYHDVVSALRPGIPPLAVLRQQGLSMTALLLEELDRLSPPGRVLFVIDDVPEGGTGPAARPVEQWCPAVGRAAVLATSRRRLSYGDAAVTHGIFVDALSTEGAVRLLTSGVSPAALDRDEWRAIAEWAGCYPLAVELLNRTVLAGMHPRELLAESRRSTVLPVVEARWDALREVLPEGTWRGVVDALSVPWNRLTLEQQHAARVLAQFAAGPVPLAVLDAIPGAPVSGAVRTALILRSYITRLDDAAPPAVGGMHPVHAEFVRCTSDTPWDDCRLAADALEPVLDAGGSSLTGESVVAAMCIPHGEAVFERLLGLADTPEREELTAGFVITLARAVAGAGAGIPVRAIELLERFLARTTLPADCEMTLSVRACLGREVAYVGDPLRAEQILAREAELQEQCAADPVLRVATLIDLARTLREQGRLRAAMDVLERARSVMRPEGTAQTTDDLINRFPGQVIALLVTQAELRCDLGNLAAASETHALLAEIAREMDPALRVTFEALEADVLIRREDWSAAAEMYARLLDVYRAELGPEHFHTRHAEASLGWVLCRLGQPREARRILRAFLRYTRRSLGASIPARVLAVNNLGETFLVEGRARFARVCFAWALAERRRMLPPWHPHVLYTACNLARSLAALGEHGQAAQLLASVLQAAGEHGAEHAERGRTELLLAELQARGAAANGARGTLSPAARAIARRMALLSPAPVPLVLLDHLEPHVFTTSVREELEGAGAITGSSHEPVPSVLTDLERMARAGGDPEKDHEALASVRDALLDLLSPDRASNERQAALARQLQPHAIRVADRLVTRGTDDTDAAAIRLLLAAFLVDQGAPPAERAAVLARLASAAHELPPAAARDAMAHLDVPILRLCGENRGTAALELASLSASVLDEKLGPDHDATLYARVNVAEAMSAAGNTDDAVEWYDELLQSGTARIRELTGSSDMEATLDACFLVFYARQSAARAFARRGMHEAALHNLRHAEPMFELLETTAFEIRSLFTQTLVICGFLGEALGVQEALVADAHRLLGANDPFTVEQERVLEQLRNATA